MMRQLINRSTRPLLMLSGAYSMLTTQAAHAQHLSKDSNIDFDQRQKILSEQNEAAQIELKIAQMNLDKAQEEFNIKKSLLWSGFDEFNRLESAKIKSENQKSYELSDLERKYINQIIRVASSVYLSGGGVGSLNNSGGHYDWDCERFIRNKNLIDMLKECFFPYNITIKAVSISGWDEGPYYHLEITVPSEFPNVSIDFTDKPLIGLAGIQHVVQTEMLSVIENIKERANREFLMMKEKLIDSNQPQAFMKFKPCAPALKLLRKHVGESVTITVSDDLITAERKMPKAKL